MYKYFVLAAILAIGDVVSADTTARVDIRPLKLGEQNCFPASSHEDTSRRDQELGSLQTCKNADKRIGWNGEGISFKLPGFHGAELHYNVHWIPGCNTTIKTQEIWRPITDDKSIQCVGLLKNNYLNCNNGGAGGWIDAGCLRYVFSLKEIIQDGF